MANLTDFAYEGSFVTEQMFSNSNFNALFAGMDFKIDEDIRLWLSHDHSGYTIHERVCDIYVRYGSAHHLDSDIIGATGLELIRPDRNSLWSIFHHLSIHMKDGTVSFFNVPKVKVMRFILGYMYFSGTLKVVELEHKMMGKQEAVHVYAKSMDRHRRSMPKLLVAKELQ